MKKYSLNMIKTQAIRQTWRSFCKLIPKSDDSISSPPSEVYQNTWTEVHRKQSWPKSTQATYQKSWRSSCTPMGPYQSCQSVELIKIQWKWSRPKLGIPESENDQDTFYDTWKWKCEDQNSTEARRDLMCTDSEAGFHGSRLGLAGNLTMVW